MYKTPNQLLSLKMELQHCLNLIEKYLTTNAYQYTIP